MADKRKEKGTIWGNARKCHGCKREFLPAVPPDEQYVLVRAESDWYRDKTKHETAPGEKIESVLSCN